MAARGNLPLAIEMLAGLLRSEDERMRFDAIQFAYLYGFGKPMEGRDVEHVELMQARHQELVAVPVEQPQLEAPPEISPPALLETTSESPVAIPPAPVLTSPTPTEAPRETTPPRGPSVSVDPKGLRCLYRGKDGQCVEAADNGHQWCKPHMAKLFEQIK